MSPFLRPLRVTAHLEAGIAHAHDWGIALDGLLAGLIHSAAKAQLLAGGGIHTPLLEQRDHRVDALAYRPLVRGNHEVGIGGGLVGSRHTREIRDLARVG